MFSDEDTEEEEDETTTNYYDQTVSDFGVFADDLIEQYLRGRITFTEFCSKAGKPGDAYVGGPSTSSGVDDENDVPLEFETVTVGEETIAEHSYIGPFKEIPSTSPKKPNENVVPPLPEEEQIIDEELLSNQTSNLLAEIMKAYAKKTAEKPPTTGVQRFDTDDNEEDEEEPDDFIDDEKDEDYIPEGKNLRSTKKSRSQGVKFAESTTDGDERPLGKRIGFGRAKEKKRKKKFGHASRNFNDDDADDGRRRRRRRSPNELFQMRRKLPEELHSLLGQANVCFVQGRVDEAMQMCHEVVRQKPQHSEPYDILASFYEQLGDHVKYLQFSLLAAHLDYHCPADKWVHLATVALEQGNRKQAVTCYTKAAKAEPTTWEYYDTKMRLLGEMYTPPRSTRLILATKQAAVKGMVKNMKQTFEEYLAFALPIFEESYATNDIGGAILCLKSCLQRGKLENNVLYKELNHYLELIMHQKRYEEALTAVFNFTELKAYAGQGDLIENVVERKRRQITKYTVPADFPVDIEAKTIICFVHMKLVENAKPLLTHFEITHKSETNVDLFLDIADALSENFYYETAESLLVSMVNCPNLPTAGVWLCYADVLSALGRLEAACKAYHNVVELAPQHINARLSLAALQQQLGLSEQALLTLDINDGETLLDLDERLLYQKCLLLEQQNDMNAYYKCARQFLAMFFKEAHISTLFSSLVRGDGSKVSNFIRPVLLETVRNGQLERLVKKVPAAAPNTPIKSEEIWNIFFKLCDRYYNEKRYPSMLHLCCYAYMCPMLVAGGVGYVEQIVPLLLLAALKTKCGRVMYIILRHYSFPQDRNSYWNMMGLIFMFSQEPTYQRFILRRMMSQPDIMALAWFSGNNSLFSGIYHHALAEYISILPKINDNPLINLLIGITYINLSTKKDINRRHDVCIQGLYFLDKYQKLRGPCHETFYNMGRAMHQLGLTYAAIYYYEKVLNTNPPVKLSNDDGDEKFDEMFDLKRLAAHNLSFIYSSSSNKAVARLYLQKYCTI